MKDKFKPEYPSPKCDRCVGMGRNSSAHPPPKFGEPCYMCGHACEEPNCCEGIEGWEKYLLSEEVSVGCHHPECRGRRTCCFDSQVSPSKEEDYEARVHEESGRIHGSSPIKKNSLCPIETCTCPGSRYISIPGEERECTSCPHGYHGPREGATPERRGTVNTDEILAKLHGAGAPNAPWSDTKGRALIREAETQINLIREHALKNQQRAMRWKKASTRRTKQIRDRGIAINLLQHKLNRWNQAIIEGAKIAGYSLKFDDQDHDYMSGWPPGLYPSHVEKLLQHVIDSKNERVNGLLADIARLEGRLEVLENEDHELSKHIMGLSRGLQQTREALEIGPVGDVVRAAKKARGSQEVLKQVIPYIDCRSNACGVGDGCVCGAVDLAREAREAVSCGPKCAWTNEEIIFCPCEPEGEAEKKAPGGE